MSDPKIYQLSIPSLEKVSKGNGLQDLLDAAVEIFVSFLRRVHGPVDYIVAVSDDWCDLVMSNQNFFDHFINEALQKAEMKVEVHASCGGGYSGIGEKIRKEFPDYPSHSPGIPHGQWTCLYRIRPRAEA